MSGQGADTLYSVDGRWMKAGQKHPSGYTIGQYDPKSKSLGMSIYGVNIPVNMQGASVQSFESPTNPYTSGAGLFAATQDPALEMSGDKNESEKWSIPSGSNAISLDDFAKLKKYSVPKDLMSKMRANAVGSGSMNDYEVQNMIHIDDYIKGVKSGSLEPNTKYYIPTSDGQVDVFTTGKDTYE
jgi:hypothetical protein